MTECSLPRELEAHWRLCAGSIVSHSASSLSVFGTRFWINHTATKQWWNWQSRTWFWVTAEIDMANLTLGNFWRVKSSERKWGEIFGKVNNLKSSRLRGGNRHFSSAGAWGINTSGWKDAAAEVVVIWGKKKLEWEWSISTRVAICPTWSDNEVTALKILWSSLALTE